MGRKKFNMDPKKVDSDYFDFSLLYQTHPAANLFSQSLK